MLFLKFSADWAELDWFFFNNLKFLGIYLSDFFYLSAEPALSAWGHVNHHVTVHTQLFHGILTNHNVMSCKLGTSELGPNIAINCHLHNLLESKQEGSINSAPLHFHTGRSTHRIHCHCPGSGLQLWAGTYGSSSCDWTGRSCHGDSHGGL